jgi:hypothetical protein
MASSSFRLMNSSNPKLVLLSAESIKYEIEVVTCAIMSVSNFMNFRPGILYLLNGIWFK